MSNKVFVNEVVFNKPTNKTYSVEVYVNEVKLRSLRSKEEVENYFNIKLLNFNFDEVVKALNETSFEIIKSEMDVS